MDFDDNDGFLFEDLTPEERDEIEKEEQERKKKIKNHPLYKKANEIYETVSALISSLPDDEQDIYSDILRESSMMLAPKLAGAMGSDSWLICMQNASIVRHHAEYLLTSTSGLPIFTSAQKDYVKVLRNEMQEFRTLFAEWVATFDQMEREDYEDEWGLFIRK